MEERLEILEKDTNKLRIKEVLYKVLKLPNMQLFHHNAELAVNMIEYIKHEGILKNKFRKEDKEAIHENTILLDGIRFYCNEKVWNNLHDLITIRYNEGDTIETMNNKVMEKIMLAFGKIGKSTNITYNKLFKNVFKFPYFESFIFVLLSHYILTRRKDETYLKRAKFDISIGEAIVKFAIHNMPNMENLFKCFIKDYGELTQEEKDTIYECAETILNYEITSDEVIAFFTKMEITDPTLQELIYLYVFDLLEKKYIKKKIYEPTLNNIVSLYFEQFKKNKKDTVKNKVKGKTKGKRKNKEKEEMKEEVKEDVKEKVEEKSEKKVRRKHPKELVDCLLQVGDFLASYFVDAGIFIADYSNVKETKTHTLKPSDEAIEAFLNAKANNYISYAPALLETQFKDRRKKSKKEKLYQLIDRMFNKFIHENPRMEIEIKEDSYLNKNPTIYKKYGIYQNYFTFLLNYLCSLSSTEESLDALCMTSFYELDNLEKIQKNLLESVEDDTYAPKLTNILAFLIRDIQDFSQCRTAQQTITYIKEVFDLDITISHKIETKWDYINGLPWNTWLDFAYVNMTKHFYPPEVKTNVIKKYRTDLRTIEEILASGDKDTELSEDEFEAKEFDKILIKSKGKLEVILFKTNKMLEDLVHHLYQRKFMFINLINNAILLCMFESFIHTTFIDARGRYYLNAGSTNIHTHLAAKLIIRLYDQTKQTPPTLEAFNIIKTNMTFPSTKKTIDQLLTNQYHHNYEKENINRILTYIENFLLPIEKRPYYFNLEEALYNPAYDVPEYLLQGLYAIVKKPKRLFYVHSLLFYERERIKNKHPKHLINHYELDASSSGLQMLSGLFRSIPLAKMCNLISHKDTQDIYTEMTDSFKKMWHDLIQVIEGCADKWDFKDDIGDSFFETENRKISFYAKLKWISRISLDDYWFLDIWRHLHAEWPPNFFFRFTPTTIVIHEEVVINLMAPDGLLFTDDMYDLLHPKEKRFYEETIKIPLFQYAGTTKLKGVLIYRMITRLDLILNYWFKLALDEFATRDLYKKAVMTFFYNSTSYGRKQDYIAHLASFCPRVLDKKFEDKLEEFVDFLDRFFIYKMQKTSDVNFMNQMIATMDLSQPITITNTNFNITLAPKVTVKKQIQAPAISGKRGLQLVLRKTLSNDIDQSKLRNMLGANIVHSMDAHVVHLLNELVFNVNQDLKAHKLPFHILHDTNHDCFYFSSPILLRVFVEECYLKCFSANYIEGISGVTDEMKLALQNATNDYLDALTPLNDNFIK